MAYTTDSIDYSDAAIPDILKSPHILASNIDRSLSSTRSKMNVIEEEENLMKTNYVARILKNEPELLPITKSNWYKEIHWSQAIFLYVHGIIHVASPYHFKVTDPEKDMILPAINGTKRILEAAHGYNKKNENKIKRIVITSSFASVFDQTKGLRPGYSYTEEDWCPLTYEEGIAAKDDPVTVYRVSKVCAERAAWDFIKNEKPSFTIATICEPMVFGPSVTDFKSIDDIHTSNSSIWSLVTSGKDGKIPETRVPKQIDVRDVAYAHIAALERITNTNQRYLISAPTSWSQQQILDIVHESTTIPTNIKNTTPIGIKGQQLPEHFNIDSSKAQNELGVTYIPFKKTIEDLIIQFSKLQHLQKH
ncbi:unnamed protein product [Adineta steineri]|uniref:NAD-dependent epimerase/dehydratase domain-containing protein n=1 Tax=Adineta steineri TaxID=433720 RepID=A0A814K9F2_9BILA|nr:unnamed protein product [Adineta steineri]